MKKKIKIGEIALSVVVCNLANIVSRGSPK